MAELDKKKAQGTKADKVKIKKNPTATSEIVSEVNLKAGPDEPTIIDLDVDNLIKLSEDKRHELENLLYEQITQTIQADAGVRAKITEAHEMYEGVPSRSSYDRNSSHFDIDDTPGIRSHFGTVAVQGKVHRYIAAMFGLAPWITINLFRKKDQPTANRKAAAIQDWLQMVLEKMVKLKKKARMIATNTGIEDVGISSTVWERCTEPEIGIESYDNLADFQKEYPSAEESGISQEEYDGYVKALTPTMPPVVPQMPVEGVVSPVLPPTPEPEPIKPISIKYKKNKIVYDFCRVDIVNRSKFGLIPANSTFETATGKFIEIDMNWNDIAKGYSEGRYSNIEQIKARVNGKSTDTNQVDQAQAASEGKPSDSPNVTYQTAKYTVYRILYNYDIDGDGLEEKCIFTLAYAQKTLIRAEYWAKNWYLVPHYIEEKSNRFEGIGIISKERNVILEADEFINLRLKAGKLAVTPSFKAKKGSAFDPGIQYFYPGVIWWLDDMNEVEQWTINVNLPEGYNEEASLERKHELLTGMTSGLSGRELPQDPNAPGIKMAMLNREGNVLINGDIDVFRDSIEQLVYNIITMAAKYLQDDDKYLEMFGLTKQDLNIAKEEMCLYGTSLAHNPEQRKADETQFMATFMANPLIQQSIESVHKITSDAIEAWGKDAEKILPTPEQLFNKQVEIQAAAMRKIQEEMAQKKEEDDFRNNLVDMGLSQDRAEKRLAEFKRLQEQAKMPITEEGAEDIQASVPMQ